MMEPGWPADHAIGVYLCVDDRKTLVATARRSRDVPVALRHLADTWEALSDPERLCVDNRWLFDAHAVTSLTGCSSS